MRSIHQIMSKPSSTQFKIPYAIITGLRPNFPKVAAYVEEAMYDFSLTVRLILTPESVVMISIFPGITKSSPKTTALRT